MSSGPHNETFALKYAQGSTHSNVKTNGNGALKQKSTQKSGEKEDPKKQTFSKTARAKPPDVLPSSSSSLSMPWLSNGGGSSRSSKDGGHQESRTPSPKKLPSSQKTPEKVGNGISINGGVGKAHGIFFPQQFSMMPITSNMHLPPQFSEAINGKRSQTTESKDLVNKISAILAAAPALRPAEKSQKTIGEAMKTHSVKPSSSSSSMAKIAVEPLRKGMGKKAVTSVSKIPPALDATNSVACQGKRSKETQEATKQLSVPIAPQRPLNISDTLKAQVTQFAASSPFNIANPANLFMQPQPIITNLISIPSNVMFSPNHLVPVPQNQIISQSSSNVVILPVKTDAPATKSFTKRKKTSDAGPAKQPAAIAPASSAQKPPEIMQNSQSSSKTASFSTMQNARNSSNEDLDQLLSCVQTKITQEFGIPSGVLSPDLYSPNPVLSFTSAEIVVPAPVIKPLQQSPEISETPRTKIEEPVSSDFKEIKPIPQEIIMSNLQRIRKRRRIRIVDLAVEEDVQNLTDFFKKLIVSPDAEKRRNAAIVSVIVPNVEANVAVTEEQTRVLPFKKRQYKSVPSPKSKDINDQNARSSSNSGCDKPSSTSTGIQARSPSSSRVPLKPKDLGVGPGTHAGEKCTTGGTPSRPPGSSKANAKVVDSTPQMALQPTIPVIEKPLSLKIILKKPKREVNLVTPEVLACTSPQSTISITSSPPSSSSATSPFLSKKRKSDSPITTAGKRRAALNKIPDYGDPQFSLANNSYPDAKVSKAKKDKDLQVCECRPPEEPNQVGCGDDCLCRMLFIECDPVRCPCAEACSNQVIQKRQWIPDLEVFQTESKGKGIRSKVSIKAGTFICEYVGEVISAETFYNRMSVEYKDSTHHYCLKLDGATVIDAYRRGNIGRYINHSCAPNSQVEKWLVDGQYRMAVFAFRDIGVNEEITYDYNFDNYHFHQKCCCGAKTCRGIIGSKKQKLSGLLMMKKTPIMDAINSLMEKRPETTSARQPPVSLVGTSTFVSSEFQSLTESSPIPTTSTAPGSRCRNSEKRLVLDQRIYLARNRRRMRDKGLDPDRRRARPGFSFLSSQNPRITLEALAELKSKASNTTTNVNPGGPVSSGTQFPTSHFKPVRWEPSPQEVAKYTQEEKEEVIRCVCNVYLDEGTMIECDNCKSWQHNECMGVIPRTENMHYLCDRCKPRPTATEIHQNLPAALNPDHLDLYVTLNVPNCQDFQARLGDCVYLTPNRSPPQPTAFYDPWTLDILKIDKMFVDGNGVKYAYGQHFLWPHEVVHEASRSFFPNELIFSPAHHETVKLEAVLGRCCIMDYVTFVKGKPREYPMEHCFICELKYTKQTKCFIKVPAKERVPLNLSKFCFETYAERLLVRRTYKPHQVPILKKKIKAEAARKKSDQPLAIIHLVKDKCQHLQNITDRLVQRNLDRSSMGTSRETSNNAAPVIPSSARKD